MKKDLTQGNEMRAMLIFSLPMILGNLLQQLYNVVDTLIVGKVLGTAALGAVGASYTLMVFLTSVNLGLCLGSGVVFAQLFGQRDFDKLKISIFNGFVVIGGLTVVINVLAFIFLEKILQLLNIHTEAFENALSYMRVILLGMIFTFIYNYLASILRSVGNSLTPLIFLGISAVLNIILDIFFIVSLDWGIEGAAIATVIAQGVSAVLMLIYYMKKTPELWPERTYRCFNRQLLSWIMGTSVLSSIQQSVMNFGILMVQGLINSFGLTVMAAYAAAVKIDSLAYMPVQDFGNAFSTFIAQNYGAKKGERIRKGTRDAIVITIVFCLFISIGVFVFAPRLMQIFVPAGEIDVIAAGSQYLRIEGVFYCLIGCLFLLYGFYRGLGKPQISLLLTIISLGTRVILSYSLAPIASIGVQAIWYSIPIGWALADLTGLIYYRKNEKQLLDISQIHMKS